MRQSRRFRVWGRVQGVGYRHFVWRRAEQLELVGWVRNRFDGSVELVASGDAQRLVELEHMLREGPRFARVERVDVLDEPEAERTPGEFLVWPTV